MSDLARTCTRAKVSWAAKQGTVGDNSRLLLLGQLGFLGVESSDLLVQRQSLGLDCFQVGDSQSLSFAVLRT